MQLQSFQTSTVTPDLSESIVLAACHAAAAAEVDYAQKAVIAGQLLIEYRQSLFCPSHRETGRTNAVLKKNQHSSDTFIRWLEHNGLAKPTAYRWMQAAENVARSILSIPAAFPMDSCIDVEGTRMPLSQALTAPETELPEAARAVRQSFFEFMQDKTLADATRAAVDGESPAHRISRAAAGKLQGGSRGEDRKNFPAFIAEKLGDISTHLSHWKGMTSAQQELVCEKFDRSLEKWPSSLLQHLQKAIKTELNRR